MERLNAKGQEKNWILSNSNVNINECIAINGCSNSLFIQNNQNLSISCAQQYSCLG